MNVYLQVAETLLEMSKNDVPERFLPEMRAKLAAYVPPTGNKPLIFHLIDDEALMQLVSDNIVAGAPEWRLTTSPITGQLVFIKEVIETVEVPAYEASELNGAPMFQEVLRNHVLPNRRALVDVVAIKLEGERLYFQGTTGWWYYYE